MSPNRRAPKQVVAYIPEDLYQTLTADADHNKRSISAQLHWIIERYYDVETKASVRRPQQQEPVHNQS